LEPSRGQCAAVDGDCMNLNRAVAQTRKGQSSWRNYVAAGDEGYRDWRRVDLLSDDRTVRGTFAEKHWGARFPAGARGMIVGAINPGARGRVDAKRGRWWPPRDGGEILNRRDVVQVTLGGTVWREGAGLHFLFVICAFVMMGLRKAGDAWRMGRRGLVSSGCEQGSRRSACGGLPLFLRFSGDRTFYGGARSGEARWRWNDVRDGRRGLGKQGGGGVDQGADHFGVRHGRGLQGLVVIEHPPSEQCFGSLLNPLVDQYSNFLAQVRSVVEPCELKTLQRGARSRLQIVERRSKPRDGPGQSSNLRAGPKGPASKNTCAQY